MSKKLMARCLFPNIFGAFTDFTRRWARDATIPGKYILNAATIHYLIRRVAATAYFEHSFIP